MSPITRILAASAVLVTAVAGVAVAQNYSAAPNYGTVNLASGFTPDPKTVSVRSGGNVDASNLNRGQHAGDCGGMIDDEPDVRLNYTSGQYPLILSVAADADTTLVVNTPNAGWVCDDDGGVNGLNPAIRFDHPQSGQYDIWIGTYANNSQQPATLYISEVSSQ